MKLNVAVVVKNFISRIALEIINFCRVKELSSFLELSSLSSVLLD